MSDVASELAALRHAHSLLVTERNDLEARIGVVLDLHADVEGRCPHCSGLVGNKILAPCHTRRVALGEAAS